MKCSLLSSGSLLLTLLITGTTQAQTLEFLHWWTSKGEQKALHALSEELVSKGVELELKSVEGGGGEPALTVLQTRALAGNVPEMALVEGVNIKSWAKLNLVYKLDAAATQGDWAEQHYSLVTQLNSVDDSYVAVPLNIHRMNWMWINQPLFDKLATQKPRDWNEFLQLMVKAKQQRVTPLALGNDPWQVAQLFENIVLSVGGKALYYDALVTLDKAALQSDKFNRALEIFRQISLLQPLPLEKISWSEATEKLASGKALIQVGGDWILGELMSFDKRKADEVSCSAIPGTEHKFLYNMDSVIFLRSKYVNQESANFIASTLQADSAQLEFNRHKGSIPVKQQLDISSFHSCQKISKQDFERSWNAGNTLPSMSDSMALDPHKQRIFNLELYRYFIYHDRSKEGLVNRLLSLALSK